VLALVHACRVLVPAQVGELDKVGFLSRVFHPPKIPVISNTTMKPYPDDPDRMRQILMAHLESPVHWMQNVKTLWDDFGVRAFVEIGPEETLCNLVGQTLEKPLCIPTCMSEGEAQAYRTGVAHLYALGHLEQDEVILSEAADRRAVSSPTPAITVRSPSEDRMAAVAAKPSSSGMLQSINTIS